MNIIENVDPIWETDKYDVVLVGTNVYCMLGNGFQSKMRFKYPIIEEVNDRMTYGDLRRLGTRCTIYDTTPTISLLYVTKYPNKLRDYLEYDALEQSLRTANAEFKGKRVMTTVIGSSLFDGNGDKARIMEIFEKATEGMDLDVYDYEQLDRKVEAERYFDSLRQLKATDLQKYDELWKDKDKALADMYLEKPKEKKKKKKV